MLLKHSVRLAALVVGALGCLYAGAVMLQAHHDSALRYIEVAPLVVAFAMLTDAMRELRRRGDAARVEEMGDSRFSTRPPSSSDRPT